jgi:hypothetical protein
MAREERDCLEALLAAAARHPRLRWRAMRELLPSPAPRIAACAQFA